MYSQFNKYQYFILARPSQLVLTLSKMNLSKSLCFSSILIHLFCAVRCDKVLYALNVGGYEHRGSDGVLYQEDTGPHRKLTYSTKIKGASDEDQRIHQTRLWDQNLNLELPIDGNGDYELTMKFADYVSHRLVNVFINEKHQIIEKLNITAMVGLHAAYDKTIEFSMLNNQLTWKNETSEVFDEKIKFKLTELNGYKGTISAVILKKKESINESIDKLSTRIEFVLLTIMDAINNIGKLPAPEIQVLSENEL
jgi:hypothetical protein